MNIQSLKKSLFVIFIIVFLILLISSNINILNNNNISINNSLNSIKENNIIIKDELNIIENNSNNNNNNNDNNFEINNNKITDNINSYNININFYDEDDKDDKDYSNSDNKNQIKITESNIRIYITKEEAERRKKERIEKLEHDEIMTIKEVIILRNYSINECRKEIDYMIKNDITPEIASTKIIPGYRGPKEAYDQDEKYKYLEVSWKPKSRTNKLLLPKPHIFIHMPKTGGTSLLQVFKKNNKPFRFYHNTQHPPHPELQNLLRKSTIYGHFRFGLHKYYDENPQTKLELPEQIVDSYLNPYSYLTMLRDPVGRTVSHYYFLKESLRHPLHKETINRTLIEWASVSQVTTNEMCRRMVGIERGAETPIDFEELCIHRLKYTFKYIGIMERFDESIVLLSHKLGYTQLLFPSENVGQQKSNHTLTDEERSLIERLNYADVRAYKIALEIFENEIDMVGREFLNQELIELKNKYIKEYGPVETHYINDPKIKKKKRLPNIRKEPITYVTGGGNNISNNNMDSSISNNGGNLNNNFNIDSSSNNGGNINSDNKNNNNFDSSSNNGGDINNINNNFSNSDGNNNNGGNLDYNSQ